MPAPSAPFTVAHQPPNADNMRGIVLMLLGFFSFAACDVQAKLLTQDLPAFQIVWFRQLGLFVGVIALLAMRGLSVLRSANPVLQIARGLTAVVSALCFTIGVTHVPLADAVAVTFIAPIMVTVLAALVLREPVGIRRAAAVAVGFVGMLIVIRPGMGVFHPAILFTVLAAFMFATRQILSRWLSGGDGIATTVAYTSITATAVASLALPFVWSTPVEPRVWAVAAGLAVTAALGEVLVIRALDVAQAVAVAPMHYSLILWSTFYGFVVFADLPDRWTILGCAIIVGSGLYTFHRERVTALRK